MPIKLSNNQLIFCMGNVSCFKTDPTRVDSVIQHSCSGCFSVHHVLRADYLPTKHFTFSHLRVCKEKKNWCLTWTGVRLMWIIHHKNKSLMSSECMFPWSREQTRNSMCWSKKQLCALHWSRKGPRLGCDPAARGDWAFAIAAPKLRTVYLCIFGLPRF